MTSIEWLVETITSKHDKSFIEFYKAEIERAKEMERQQIGYSEEEVVRIVQRLMYDVHCGGICEGDKLIDFKISPIKWFEKFKKK